MSRPYRFGWLLCVFSTFVFAGELERNLRATFQGAWVILKTEAYSNCDGYYSNNQILDGRVTSKAKNYFAPGELGKIQKLNVKRSRVVVLITLTEPLLTPREEGPFTLYDERSCKVELRFDLGRATIKQRDIATIETALNAAFVMFDQEGPATASKLYNQRQMQPYPDDYDQTLAAYDAWKIEQKQIEIDRKIDECLREMDRILARVDDNPEYARGFIAGIKAMKLNDFGDCDNMLNAYPSSYTKKPPGRITAGFKDGYDDGQKIAFFQETLSILRSCPL